MSIYIVEPDRPAIRRLLAALLISAVFYSPVLFAQTDWRVLGDAEGLLLTEDEDDGLNGEAEINLTVDWMHYDTERNVHTRLTTTRAVRHDHDVQDLNLQGLGLEQVLDTVECHGPDPVWAGVQVTEQDMSSNAESALSLVAGAVVGVTVSIQTTNPYAGATAGALSKYATKQLLRWMGSGTDDLGTLPMTQLAFGENYFDLSGGDGGSRVRLRDESFQDPTIFIECSVARGERTTVTQPDPDTAVADIFPPLLSALADISLITEEDGSVDAEVMAGRASLTTAVVSLAEFAAVFALAEAQFGFDGASVALPYLDEARVHQSNGQWQDAIEDYREAFRAAYTAVWNGNLGTPFSLPFHMTVTSPVRSVRPNSYHEFQGIVQGLSGNETIQSIDISGQGAGMEFLTRHGFERTAVVLADLLDSDLRANQLVGLGRISDGVIKSADANCNVEHLEEGSIGAGVFIDGNGPFTEPDPDGCGYGEVVVVASDVENGGIPAGTTPDENGVFTVQLNLGSDLQPGTYNLTLTAQVMDSSTSASRQVSSSFTLLVPRVDDLFTDRFEM